MTIRWTKWLLTCPNCFEKGHAIITEVTELARSTWDIYELSPEYAFRPKARQLDIDGIVCEKCNRIPVREASAAGLGLPPQKTNPANQLQDT